MASIMKGCDICYPNDSRPGKIHQKEISLFSFSLLLLILHFIPLLIIFPGFNNSPTRAFITEQTELEEKRKDKGEVALPV